MYLADYSRAHISWLLTYIGRYTFWAGHSPSNTSATTAQILQLINDSFEGNKDKKAVFSCLSKFAAIPLVLLVLVVRTAQTFWSVSKIKDCEILKHL